MMAVTFIEDSLLHGGTQIWVAEAIGKLRARGHPVSAIVPAGSWIEAECREAGGAITSYDWDTVGPDNPESRKQWIEGMSGADVVVQTVNPPRRNFQGVLFAAECLVAAELDAHLVPKTGTIVPSYLPDYYRPDPRVPTTILAITDFTRRHMIDEYGHPAGMVELIYQGTDICRFRSTPSHREEAAVRYPVPQDGGPVLGCVGTYEERKGQMVLLDAMRWLVSNGLPKTQLVLVGDGADEAKIRSRIVELGLQNSVALYPFTRELEFAYEMIDILVVPSTHKEGLPNVLVESMAMGIPSVATRLAGIPELVEDGKTGQLVNPGSVEDLATAISSVWTDQDGFAVMRQNARDRVVNDFDKRVQFDRFVSMLEDCANRGRGIDPVERDG